MCIDTSRKLASIHRDQHGTISIVSVFAVLLLTILLGMVINVGRHADEKIKMQNAADAAAYSGGLVLARGMNTLAFTNHLLFDVFAVTAFMREARERNSETYVPGVLGAWRRVGPVFSSSKFPKFEQLGAAIIEKVPREQEVVQTYSEWAAASSERILPLMEEILKKELIPEFQRAVVEAFPDIAQTAAMEVARRSGESDHDDSVLRGVLWRTSVVPVGGQSKTFERTLPVIDPVTDFVPSQAQYQAVARYQREAMSHRHLGEWNYYAMWFFDREAKMCQFARLWRNFTCGHLNQLLTQEYPTTNLPFVIRTEKDNVTDMTTHLDRDFTFLGVVYRRKRPGILPGLFCNPLDSDAMAYAAVRLFVPRRRIMWYLPPPPVMMGGVPGEFPDLPGDEEDSDGEEEEEPGNGQREWVITRQPHTSDEWDLLNQHWTVQLVPAVQATLPDILQTVPPLPEFQDAGVRLPDLSGLTKDDICQISTH